TPTVTGAASGASPSCPTPGPSAGRRESRGTDGSTMRRHETLFLLASAAVAAAAPPALKSWVDGRLRDGVEPALSRAPGLPGSIGEAEARLRGRVVLRHVRVGDTFAAEAVSARVGVTR